MFQAELNTIDIATAPAEHVTVHENAITAPLVASRKNYLAVKRITDIIISVPGIPFFLSWLVPLIGILIKMGSRGPVFFLQQRIGWNGKSFCCYKFRSMVNNEEADERPAARDDERVTPGREIFTAVTY